MFCAMADRSKMAEDRQVLLAVSIATLIIIGGWLLKSSLQRGKYRLPPQVPGLPIFGNTFQIPAVQQGPWAKDLAEKYGEMFVLSPPLPSIFLCLSSRTSSLVALCSGA